MKKLVQTLSIIIFITSLIFAQNRGKIQGQVTDAATKEPLAGVNVVVEGTAFGAATDAEGYYFVDGLEHDTYRL